MRKKLNRHIMQLTREVMREFAIGPASHDTYLHYLDPDGAYHLSFGLATEPIENLFERLSWGNGSGNVFVRDTDGDVLTFTVTPDVRTGHHVGEPTTHTWLRHDAPLHELLAVLQDLPADQVLQRHSATGEPLGYLSPARRFPITLADKT